MERSVILIQDKPIIKRFIMILLMITLVSGAFLQGTCKTSAATGDVVRTLNCNIVINFKVKVEFNEYRHDEYGNPTDDRCDGVKAKTDGVVKIPATVKTVRHINGLTNYSVTINKKQNWEAEGWGAGENYEYEQGSWIKCSGYVKADNLTMSGVVSNSQFDAAGHGLFDITDRFGNDFTFVMDNYYDTNTDWVIDYMDSTGTGITGISLEFIYPAYTVTYDNGGGTGSIASSDVGYNQKFTLSDGAGMSKEGYELDNWCVLRKTHRNSYNDFDIMTEVFCTDGQWHEFTGAYATNTADAKWQTYNKKSSYIMDGAWIKGEWDNVFVFCAQWIPDTIKVTLDNNGGQKGTGGLDAYYYQYKTGQKYSNSKGNTVYYYNSSTINKNTWITNLVIPKRTGYSFGGYYTGKDGSGTQYVNSKGEFVNALVDNNYNNITLYAKWIQNTIKVTLDNNGGQKGTGGLDAYYYQYKTGQKYSNSKDTVYYYNSSTINKNTWIASLVIPKRAGYSFGGYYTGKNGSGTQYVNSKGEFVNALVDNNYNNITLYAKWVPNTAAYTIKHYLQNADGTYSYRESTTGNAAIGNTIADMRNNYDGYTQPAVKSVKISSNASDNIIEYRYPRKTYKINISGDKGISAVRHYSVTDSKTKDSYRWGESVRINADVKDGYTWSKWTGVSDITTKKYDFTMPSSDVNRKAVTISGKYKITYTKGDTDVNDEDVLQDVENNADVKMKSGNIFTGRTYSITYDKGYDGSVMAELPDNISQAHLTFKNWSIDGKNITKNGGETFKYQYSGNITATANWNSYSLKLESAERTGYTFTGWICSEDGKLYKAGDTYVIKPQTSAANIKFTAQWDADGDVKYTVRHWKQKLYLDGTQQYTDSSIHDENNYFIADTDNLTGTADTQVIPDVRNYEGFTSPAVQTAVIHNDGSLVVDYYYTRNRYKAGDGGDDDNGSSDADSDKGNGIADITGNGTYYYEEEVSMEAVVKPGYHWHINDECDTDKSKYPTGWKETVHGYGVDKFLDNTGYGSQKIKFAMPAHDVYVKADATNNSYTIIFDADGGTGDMEPAQAVYDVSLDLPGNIFIKTTPSGSSTFLHWEDRRNDTAYEDTEEVKNLTDEFNGVVTLYAIWDNAPEITAQERWFTVDDAQNNKITLEELLSTAKVTDDIDTDIEDSLTVKHYNAGIFTQFKTDGYVMVTYTARDSSNNTTEATVKVNIVDTTAVEEEKNTYPRFISPKHYRESYEDGGLEGNSIWRNNPEYASTLERAMNNRESMTYSYNEMSFFGINMRARKAGSDSRDHLVEQWVFSNDDVKAVKEYISEHGIGNLKEADALADFRTQFIRCRTK